MDSSNTPADVKMLSHQTGSAYPRRRAYESERLPTTRFCRRAAFLIVLICLWITPAAIGAAVDDGPQLNWQQGPAVVGLSVAGTAIEVPAGSMYLTNRDQLAAMAKYFNNAPAFNGALAVITPRDLSRLTIVYEEPQGLGPDNGVNLISDRRKDALLRRFQTVAYQDSVRLKEAGEPTRRITGWEEQPLYEIDHRRMLYLPFRQLSSDGEAEIELVGYVSNAKTCLRFEASVSPDQGAVAKAEFLRLCKSVTVPDVPADQLPKALGSQSPSLIAQLISGIVSGIGEKFSNFKETMLSPGGIAVVVLAILFLSISEAVKWLIRRLRLATEYESKLAGAESAQSSPEPPPPPPDGTFP